MPARHSCAHLLPQSPPPLEQPLLMVSILSSLFFPHTKTPPSTCLCCWRRGCRAAPRRPLTHTSSLFSPCTSPSAWQSVAMPSKRSPARLLFLWRATSLRPAPAKMLPCPPRASSAVCCSWLAQAPPTSRQRSLPSSQTAL